MNDAVIRTIHPQSVGGLRKNDVVIKNNCSQGEVSQQTTWQSKPTTVRAGFRTNKMVIKTTAARGRSQNKQCGDQDQPQPGGGLRTNNEHKTGHIHCLHLEEVKCTYTVPFFYTRV